jgi:Na+-transporting NADH:ubiquinone oxidoreductase subunit C
VDKNSTGYTLFFASAVTIVCAVLLGVAATQLKDLQIINADVDKKSKILLALGEFDPDEPISSEQIRNFFSDKGNEGRFVVKFAVNHAGEKIEGLSDDDLKDIELFTEMKNLPDGKGDSAEAKALTEANQAKRKYPIYAYYKTKEALDAKKPTNYVVPIFGYGLWSNCFGVIALDSTGKTVQNLVYYDHKETPGLGGEIEKPKFTDPFKGLKVHNAEGKVALKTTKGDLDENSAPAVSGATFTMDGVNKMFIDFLTIYDVYIAKQRGADQ